MHVQLQELIKNIRSEKSAYCQALLFCMMLVLSNAAHAAVVENVSSELLEQEGEDAYWQALVSCEGSSQNIAIRQKLKQDEWCVKSGELACAGSKKMMANKVCENIESLASTSNSAPARKAPAVAVSKPKASQSQPATRVSTLRRAAPVAAEQPKQKDAVEIAMQKEELSLQQERNKLEREKRELEVAERKLEERSQRLEQRLSALDE
ncbi:MAG: hypothetical protein KTR35_13090 [Gammaproteobacteria bacterium]|nr:hypothetical protein [Gammaproteobacteria bacterium]